MGKISPQTIEQIIEVVKIEDVVGEWVALKKRGANLLGVCPFHNEKTPSFTVSPAKGIYKCFGCGKAGNSVNFVMEHEHFSYPETLRWLAKKYNIEIEEDESVNTDQWKEEQSEKESLFIVNTFAEKFFEQQLFETDSGRSIGLSYFKERGFTTEIIKKFKLGYNPSGWQVFFDAAREAGYKPEYLEKAGLVKKSGDRHYDAYRDRVMFPIHNIAGRVIGFGGRILITDKNQPKYINSPANEIYDKSRSLYGLHFAKNSIVQQDNCLLVEGYTDVISLHQAGATNAVASLGTSLTEEQIRLIKRYTNNITILYDGDLAGIKASFRGIDMILAEGMNVKVVLFPDGEDPDSYSRAHGELVKTYITENAKDFIVFKTNVLANETKNDPIKRANLIQDIVHSIYKIPNLITRTVFIAECSRILQMDERVLNAELNRLRRSEIRKGANRNEGKITSEVDPEAEAEVDNILKTNEELFSQNPFLIHEQEIARILLNFGSLLFECEVIDSENKTHYLIVTVAEYIVHELQQDDLVIIDPMVHRLFNMVVDRLAEGKLPEPTLWSYDSDIELTTFISEKMLEKYELHNWESRNVVITTEDIKIFKVVASTLTAYKRARIINMLNELQNQLKEIDIQSDDLIINLDEQRRLNQLKKHFSDKQGVIVLR